VINQFIEFMKSALEPGQVVMTGESQY